MKEYTNPVSHNPFVTGVIDKRVTIELSLRCNSKCIFCSRNASPSVEGCPLSKEEVDEILVDAKEKGICYVEFAGGEAVLDKNLPYYFRRVHELGMETQLITNGQAFSNKDLCDELLPLIDYLQLSVPCYDRETYDKLMGIPGAFNKLQKAFENIKEYTRPVSLFIILLKSTLPFLVSTAEKFNTLPNLKNISLMYPYLEGRMFTCLEEFLPFSEMWDTLFPFLLRIKTFKGPKPGVGCGLAPFCAFYPFERELRLPTKITPTGKEVARKYSDNSISEYKVEDILLDRNKLPFCRECIYDKVCYGIPLSYKILFNDLKPITIEDDERRKERQPAYIIP